MPKLTSKVTLRINLLKPQSSPDRLWVRLVKWVLTSGRVIVIFVELIVLSAFLSRFKLDSDIADTKELIDQQIPFIESLKRDENIIRKTQLQLATIKDKKEGAAGIDVLFDKIASQSPQALVLDGVTFNKNEGVIDIKMSGRTRSPQELSIFVAGLKNRSGLTKVNITNIGYDGGLVIFSVSAQQALGGGKKL